jgi:hypothetical protein
LLLEGCPRRLRDGSSHWNSGLSSGAQTTSHMFVHHNTSAQQRRAACSPQRRRRMSALPLPSPLGDYEAKDHEAGRPRSMGARPVVSETKTLMVAVLGEFGRPMTSAELYAVWDGTKPLQAIEYHLSTLVKAKVAEVVFGPELHFQLVPVPDETESLFRKRCR